MISPKNLLSNIIQEISADRIYQDLFEIEGIRHAVTNPSHLLATQIYLTSELEKLGLDVIHSEFRLEGFDEPFVNIEAKLHPYPDGEPEILITSHYDSVYNSPGADDSGSAVAIMLEAARVLKQISMRFDTRYNVRFVSFTLEEGNPVWFKKINQKARELSLIATDGTATTLHFAQLRDKFQEAYIANRQKSGSILETFELAYEGIQELCLEDESEYFDYYIEIIREIHDPAKIFGNLAIVGSNYFLSEIIPRNLNIKGVINLECVGYTDKMEHSQRFPSSLQPEVFKVHGTKPALTIGDFLIILADGNSLELAEILCNAMQQEEINLPYAYLSVPYPFEIIQKNFIDLLRSDHAGFWKKQIPALILSDSANFRTPFYHNQADTIDKLDFDFMMKVCQSVVLSVISYFN